MAEPKVKITKSGGQYHVFIDDEPVAITDEVGARKYGLTTPSTVLLDPTGSRNQAPTISPTGPMERLNEIGRDYFSPTLRGIVQQLGAVAGGAVGGYTGARVGGPATAWTGATTGKVAGSAAGSAAYDQMLESLQSPFLGLPQRKGLGQEYKNVWDYLGEGLADRAGDKAVRAVPGMSSPVINSVISREIQPIKDAVAKILPKPKKEVLEILAEQEARGYTDPMQPTAGQMRGGIMKWAENFLGGADELEARKLTQAAALRSNIDELLTKTNSGTPTSITTGNQALAPDRRDITSHMNLVRGDENAIWRKFDDLARQTTTDVEVVTPTTVQGNLRPGGAGGTVQVQNPPIPGTPAAPRNPNLPYYAQSGTAATPPTAVPPTNVNVAPFGNSTAGAQSFPPTVTRRTIEAPVYLSNTTQVSQGTLDRINALIAEQQALGMQGNPLQLQNLHRLRDVAEQLLSGPKEVGTGRAVLPYSIVKPLKNAAYGDEALNKFGASLYADARRSMQDWKDAGSVEKIYQKGARATTSRMGLEDSIEAAARNPAANPEKILERGIKTGWDVQQYLRAGGDKRKAATAFLRDAFQNSTNPEGIWQPHGIQNYLDNNKDVLMGLTNEDQRNQIKYLLKKMSLANTSDKPTGNSLVLRGMNAALVLGSQALGANFGPYPMVTSVGALGVVPMAEMFTNGMILDPKVSRTLVALSQTQPGTPAASRLTQTLLGAAQGMRMMVTLPSGEKVPAVVGPDKKLHPEEPTASTPQ